MMANYEIVEFTGIMQHLIDKGTFFFFRKRLASVQMLLAKKQKENLD